MFRLIYLMGAGLWLGLKGGYLKWEDERYKAKKWLTARCVICSKGFKDDEAIYETGEGYKHRACHYDGMNKF